MKSRTQLIEGSKPHFEQHPNVQKLYATSDSNYFLPTKQNAALMHAKDNRLKLYEITRFEAIKGDVVKKMQAEPKTGTKAEDAKTGTESDDAKTGTEQPEGSTGSKRLSEEELKDELLQHTLEKAVELGVVSKSSNWYKFGEVTLGNGDANAKEKLANDPDLLTELSDAIAKADQA